VPNDDYDDDNELLYLRAVKVSEADKTEVGLEKKYIAK
jgi:hypothetical protein